MRTKSWKRPKVKGRGRQQADLGTSRDWSPNRADTCLNSDGWRSSRTILPSGNNIRVPRSPFLGTMTMAQPRDEAEAEEEFRLGTFELRTDSHYSDSEK
jgi:hypothetical protein